MKLPLKLAILVIVIFGLLITGMVLWKPLRIKYYSSLINSDNEEDCTYAAKQLCSLNHTKPVFKYYNKLYSVDDVRKRIIIVNELCSFGDMGKRVLRDIFRNRCLKEMVQIPFGAFGMGGKYPDELPVHDVFLATFRMDKYEVTNEKYYTFFKATGHQPPDHLRARVFPYELGSYPVINVTWNDAKSYADWLGMRLPTEAEWEYACRAGSAGDYCFGNVTWLVGEYAWFYKNSGGKTNPVGLKKPNSWGLYDMHGNVWEWCLDWYDDAYYAKSPKFNPQGPSNGEWRVFRGGSWNDDLYVCRASRRFRGKPWYRNDFSGFRLADKDKQGHP